MSVAKICKGCGQEKYNEDTFGMTYCGELCFDCFKAVENLGGGKPVIPTESKPYCKINPCAQIKTRVNGNGNLYAQKLMEQLNSIGMFSSPIKSEHINSFDWETELKKADDH